RPLRSTSRKCAGIGSPNCHLILPVRGGGPIQSDSQSVLDIAILSSCCLIACSRRLPSPPRETGCHLARVPITTLRSSPVNVRADVDHERFGRKSSFSHHHWRY